MIMKAKKSAAYTPVGTHLTLFTNRAPEILHCGPARTGKTRAALEKALLFAFKYHGARVLLVRKTRASMTESTLQIFEDHVCPPGTPWVDGAHRSHRTSYILPNASIIVVVGLNDVERLKSSEYDFVVGDEATEFDENDWEIVLSRLSGRAAPYRQAIACCNPSAPNHWLKRRADEGQMLYLSTKFSDNPVLDDDVIQRLSRLTGHRRARLYEGLWSAAEGIVYDLSSCLVPHQEPPAGERYGSIDFGFAAPCACLTAVVYKDESLRDVIYIYADREQANQPIEVHAAWLRSHGGPDCIVYADPENPDARRELVKHGVVSIPANNAVLFGIDRVNSAIEGNRLFISENCRSLIECCAAYAYGVDGVKPVKKNDHLADALRYLIASVGNTMETSDVAADTCAQAVA